MPSICQFHNIVCHINKCKISTWVAHKCTSRSWEQILSYEARILPLADPRHHVIPTVRVISQRCLTVLTANFLLHMLEMFHWRIHGTMSYPRLGWYHNVAWLYWLLTFYFTCLRCFLSSTNRVSDHAIACLLTIISHQYSSHFKAPISKIFRGRWG